LFLDAEKDYCLIKLSDNGIGFDQKYSDKIFEVFQRLYDKELYQGTGIGLAIVKKIVENHKGFIVAKGEPGIGATFEIYIPFAATDAD
ncbi:sensor histidine kinase, partial [Flavobacterium sp.]